MIKINNWVLNTGQVVIAILSVAGSIASIYSIYQAYNSSQGISWIALLSFTVVVLFLVIYFNKKTKREHDNYLESFSDAYHDLAHTIRDELYLLDQAFESGELNDIEVFVGSSMNKVAVKSVNNLERLISNLTKEKVSVCIKHFDIRKPWEEKPQKMYVTTLCRSTASKSDRNNYDAPAEVTKNTDFNTIITSGTSYFAITNLTKFAKKAIEQRTPPYQNTTPGWEKYYNCTIVVPIRIKAEYLPSTVTGQRSSPYHVLGFLCVDSTSTKVFNEDNIEFFAKCCCGFADALYRYFERCRYYLSDAS